MNQGYFSYESDRTRALDFWNSILAFSTTGLILIDVVISCSPDFFNIWESLLWINASFILQWIYFNHIYRNWIPNRRRSYYYIKGFQYIISCTGIWFLIRVLRIIHFSTIDEAAESFGMSTDEMKFFLAKRIYVLVAITILLFISVLYECYLQCIDRKATSELNEPLLVPDTVVVHVADV